MQPQQHPEEHALLERIAQLESQQRELSVENAELRRLVTKLGDHQSSLVQRIDNLDSRVWNVFRRAGQIDSVLQSRIWRLLVMLGGIALRITEFPLRVRRLLRRSSARPTTSSESIYLNCDEPDSESRTEISGVLRIQGWAVAETGIERIELRSPGCSPALGKCGLYRSDLSILYPSFSGSQNSGFLINFDTQALPTGTHTITLRVVAKSGQSRDFPMTLEIDHVNGAATPYARWIKEFEADDPEMMSLRTRNFPVKPLISVLVPVYRTDPAILERMIESVRVQVYPHWELCIVDDGSKLPEVDEVLERSSGTDRRIKVHRAPTNGGISAASNLALSMSSGEYIALLDHDDELTPDALFYVVEAINSRPNADILYSDEDHIDETGYRFDPFFKPEWSPDLILSENYVCHLMVFRRALGISVGGFRSETDLSQDHDILLRMSLHARNVIHIPRILYHWRTDTTSMQRASAIESKALVPSKRALEDYLREANIDAAVEPGRVPGRWRVRYRIPEGTRLSILIPSGGKLNVLEKNLDALISKTEYSSYEIVIIDNSKGDSIKRYAERLARPHPFVRYMDMRDLPFNYSRLNNLAALECQSDLLLFLNDDTRLIEPDSIRAMVELAVRPEVGAVGAKLLYPDGRIQHGGIAMGIFGICGHSFKGLFGSDRFYFDFPDVIRNVSAVTGACLMVPSRVFHEVGGFDEERFPVAYNDVDLCLKIGAKGYRVLYTPHAELTHYEAFSKTQKDLDPRPAETDTLKRKWKAVIDHDPFYSPNLTRTCEAYSFRRRTLLTESPTPSIMADPLTVERPLC